MGQAAAFRWESFMRRTIHCLVLTSFAIHVVFGCCLHHVHAAAFGAEVVVADTACPCGHHEGEPSQPEQSTPPCSDCDGDHCVFARASATDAPELAADPGVVAFVRVGPILLDLGRAEAVDSPLGYFGPPVRLHLLKQLLLL
jgi:hypothetical protein